SSEGGCTMGTRRLVRAFGVVLLVGVSGPASAQEESKYPRVNLAVTYEVDAQWPQKPKDFVWGHVPGIAVDAKDNVYVFTRATPPVQVYDASGRYVRGWGEKSIGPLGAHHIKIDAEGNVWTSDIVNHTVEK